MSEIELEYRRLRCKNFTAREAFRAARINIAFEAAENHGCVRIQLDPEWEVYDDSYVDTWDISESQKKREKAKIQRRIEREGHWILYSQYLTNEGWETADSIGGFIGKDWKDSGYDTDVKLAALIAVGEFLAQNISHRM